MRNHTTILLVTRDRLVRADFARGTLAGLYEQATPPVEDFPSLVEAALQLSRSHPGRVWVLSTEIWTQTLGLAAETAGGLSAAELGQVLAFESEPFSGLSGLEARIGFVELPHSKQERLCWLCAMSALQLEQVEYVIDRAGGRLAGVGHPGGVGEPLAAHARGEPWQRIELWPGAMVCLRASVGDRPVVRVSNTNPAPGRWQDDARPWEAESGAAHQEILHATASVPREEMPACLSLDDGATQEAFFSAWARHLASRPLAVPMVVVPKRPMSAAARRGLSAVLALVALVICLGHFLWTDSLRRAQLADTARLRGPAERWQQFKKEADAAREKSRKLAAECEKLGADINECRKTIQGHRQRVAALMRVLARQNTGEIVLERVDAKGDGVALHGTSLSVHAADRLTSELSAALEPLGWRVRLPKRQAAEALPGGGPWQFEVHVHDAASSGRSPEVSAASNGSHHRGE